MNLLPIVGVLFGNLIMLFSIAMAVHRCADALERRNDDARTMKERSAE